MIVNDLRSNTVGLVTAASAGTACDLADFGPCLLRVLLRVNVTQPFHLWRVIALRTRVASASASSVLPLLINRFLRRSNAFTAGVTNFGSDDVTVISRSG